MSLKKYLNWLWQAAENRLYNDHIDNLIESGKDAFFVDLGCGPGVATQACARKMQTSKVVGVEITEKFIIEAEKRGIEVRKNNLNERFPFEDESVDVVYSNQVIEHLADLDHFLSEIWRILKKGGYVVTCSENLSSWHNIFALSLGFQPFSLSNIIRLRLVGNPLSLHKGALSGHADSEGKILNEFCHHKILSYEAFKDIFKAYGFKIEKVMGSGYYPFPPAIADFLTKIDVRHSAFLSVKARKY